MENQKTDFLLVEKMRLNREDKTLKKNYIQVYQYLIKEYEQVKKKEHAKYKKVGEFYQAHGACRQTFLKYYGRYRRHGFDEEQLLPGKRGAKYKSRRIESNIDTVS